MRLKFSLPAKKDHLLNMDQEDGNVSDVTNTTASGDHSGKFNAMKIVILVIACVGIITNAVVVIVFLNDRKLRRKIPNICIINQVCFFFTNSIPSK